jgi:hypothetical protein
LGCGGLKEYFYWGCPQFPKKLVIGQSIKDAQNFVGPHNYAIRVTIFIPKIVMNNSFTRKTCTKMMKPCQTLLQESTQRKGEKKESKG